MNGGSMSEQRMTSAEAASALEAITLALTATNALDEWNMVAGSQIENVTRIAGLLARHTEAVEAENATLRTALENALPPEGVSGDEQGGCVWCGAGDWVMVGITHGDDCAWTNGLNVLAALKSQTRAYVSPECRLGQCRSCFGGKREFNVEALSKGEQGIKDVSCGHECHQPQVEGVSG